MAAPVRIFAPLVPRHSGRALAIVCHCMRRFRLLGSCAFILFLAFVLWMACFHRHPPGLSPREIANALVEFHHHWETNGYRSPGTGVPRALESPSIDASSAGLYGAYVQYKHGMLGAEWSSRYHILRANTNEAVWTLYDIRCLERPRVPWVAWKHKMITVTNAP